MIQIFLIAVILLSLAFAGIGIRMLLQKNGSAPGTSCSASSKLDQVDGCGCEGHCSK